MTLQASVLPPDFGVGLGPEEFEERFVVLHKQLFASTDFAFDDVTTHVFYPPAGMYQVDHSIVHDGERFHLFYCTGDMTNTEEWIRRRRAGDLDGANEVCVEPGNGHAVGGTLSDLEFQENVFHPPQGRFDMMSRSVCSVFRCGDRWGMLYVVRGEMDGRPFTGMSLAWSDDLADWELDRGNPCLGPPHWASAENTCKDPHVMMMDGIYLIYYIVMGQDGYCTLALATTTDWKSFHDEGPVFRAAPMLRGTMGVESPVVAQRNGIWHLFFTHGPGLWHAVSRNPRSFVSSREAVWDVGTGIYYVGPFHATEVIEHRGQWWLTTDRKEESRRLNRVAGRLAYRGSYEDEKVLEEGIYLSRIRWEGDQPILVKP